MRRNRFTLGVLVITASLQCAAAARPSPADTSGGSPALGRQAPVHQRSPRVRPILAKDAPALSLSEPPDGSVFVMPVDIELVASVPETASFSQLDFLANDEVIGSVSSPLYSMTWRPPAEGSYALTAVGQDIRGVSTYLSAGVGQGRSRCPALDLPARAEGLAALGWSIQHARLWNRLQRATGSLWFGRAHVQSCPQFAVPVRI